VRKIAALFFAILLSLLTPYAFADVAAIHADKLPQETAVLAALDDAKQLEPYSHSWTNKWQYSVAKEEVATRLGKDLGFLTIAVKNHPDNSELLLLTGLVARYAYNLDIEGSHKMALNALEQAQKLAPSDIRAPWFRATLNCQSNQHNAGAEEFLSIEASQDWEKLPIAFWDDYIDCAVMTNMPAHALRAADHQEKLHAAESKMRTALVDVAHKHFDAFDPMKTYEPKDVWHGTKIGEDIVLTGTSCGLRLHVRGDWKIKNLALEKRECAAYFGSGYYHAVTRDLGPSVIAVVKQPASNETLQDLFKKYITKADAYTPFTPSKCPVASCAGMIATLKNMYGTDGDGKVTMVAFEREQPEFPGLIFETPMEVPKSNGGEQVQYYRPNQTQQRMPGKLYYLIMLDAASAIEEPAMKDFDFFLTNLTVE